MTTISRLLPERFSAFGAPILRLGLAAVILWFGTSQLMSPDMWTSWVPAWTHILGLSEVQVVYLNGSFEVLFGALLVLGIAVSPVALLLSAHLALIVFEIGINPTGVRDFGLALALLALAFDNRPRWPRS